jgi:hypothetical protein
MAAALLAVGLVAGCTTSEAGEATPGTGSESTPPSTESSEPSSPSSVDIPPPPRELSLDGLDPCTLFTDAQREQLHIDDVDAGVGESEIYKDMKECTLDAQSAEPFRTYNVLAVTNVDVSFWLNERRNADAELISVAGYPAAQFHTKGVEGSDCAIAVGVAKNQHLHVEMHPISEKLQQDEICQLSIEAADMAMQTLQTLR